MLFLNFQAAVGFLKLLADLILQLNRSIILCALKTKEIT